MMTGRPDRRGYDKLCYEAHLDRLKSIKPNIDNSLPKQANFVKSKRIVEKRRECEKIEMKNKALLERLATIIQTKHVDNQLNSNINTAIEFRKKNLIIRKRNELQKITEANHRLLKRIQEVPSTYNIAKWEIENKQKEEIKRHLALYPEFYDKLDKEKEMKKTLLRTNHGFNAMTRYEDMKRVTNNHPSFLPDISHVGSKY